MAEKKTKKLTPKSDAWIKSYRLGVDITLGQKGRFSYCSYEPGTFKPYSFDKLLQDYCGLMSAIENIFDKSGDTDRVQVGDKFFQKESIVEAHITLGLRDSEDISPYEDDYCWTEMWEDEHPKAISRDELIDQLLAQYKGGQSSPKTLRLPL